VCWEVVVYPSTIVLMAQADSIEGESDELPSSGTIQRAVLRHGDSVATDNLLNLIERGVVREFMAIKIDDLPVFTSQLIRVLSQAVSGQTDGSYIDKLLSCREKTVQGLLTRLLSDRAGAVGIEIPPRKL
jgi:hypothetical protein